MAAGQLGLCIKAGEPFLLGAWPSATFFCSLASPGSWLPGVPCSASGFLTLASAVAVSWGRAAGCPAEPSAGSPCRPPSPSGPWLLAEGWAEAPSPFSGAGASVSFVELGSGSFFGSGDSSSFSGFGGLEDKLETSFLKLITLSCAGSLLLHAGFLQFREQGLLSVCRARASCGCGFSYCEHGP